MLKDVDLCVSAEKI